ncbi:MAG TPA: DUF882 domain-containing protein, partial [Anaerolineae bacterium]|nr:DUF882 domain-containing protein [Anaerolineae bacterium]
MSIEAQQKPIPDKIISRRGFLKTGAGTVVGLLSASTALGAIIPRQATEKRLHFYNAHTGERLNVCYCVNGRYLNDALLSINYILRDFR